MARILIIGGDGELAARLASAGDVVSVRSADEARGETGALRPDVVVVGEPGELERVRARWPELPAVMAVHAPLADHVVAWFRAGAADVVSLPDEAPLLLPSVIRAVRRRAADTEVDRMSEAVREARFEDLVGISTPMRRLYGLIERVAGSDASVLITGETGTGKELVARALHRRSPRRGGPFVAVNCAAMPEALLESELFGHVRGAFTDARESRKGLFQRANGGTLFLDEVGDMPLGLQPKLLRAVQERALRPVGSDEEVSFDVRVIAATHQDLESAVEARRFRQDLYYRLNVIHIELPPLRDRGGDILVLASSFLERAAARVQRPVRRFSTAAARRMLEYRWPGNVRELQNCVERVVAVAVDHEVTLDDLPDRVRNFKSSHVLVAADHPSELVTLEEVERRYILRVLAAVGGNRHRAAELLAIDRKTLYRKLKAYGVEDPAGP